MKLTRRASELKFALLSESTIYGLQKRLNEWMTENSDTIVLEVEFTPKGQGYEVIAIIAYCKA